MTLLVACGKPQDRGIIVGAAIPGAVVEDKLAGQRGAPARGTPDQILFGDLHVHTTFSPDAFIMSLPLMGGSGLHPPADACHFGRNSRHPASWSTHCHAESY